LPSRCAHLVGKKIDPAAFGNAAQAGANRCTSLPRGQVKESYQRRLLFSKQQQPHLEPNPDGPRQFGVARDRDHHDVCTPRCHRRGVPNLSDPQDVEIPHPLFERTIQGTRQFLTKPSSTYARRDVLVNQDRFENGLMSTLSKSGKATK
jgi:hypothetical protein